MIKIDVSIGDTILVGRFKNKKIVVKSIGKDDHAILLLLMVEVWSTLEVRKKMNLNFRRS